MIRVLAALVLAVSLIATPALAAKGGAPAGGAKAGDKLPTGEELFPLDRMKVLLPGDPVRVLMLDLVLIVDPGQAMVMRSKRTPVMNAITESLTKVSGDTFLDGNEAAIVKKLAREAVRKGGFTEVRDVLIKFMQLR